MSRTMASLGADDLAQQTAATRKSATAAEETPIDTNIHDDSTTTNRKQIASTIHWFAQVGSDAVDDQLDDGAIDRDDRLRMIKDRQNEERQRKLEELKAQAVAAQKYREQKEEERRRRIDDMRVRELDRKQQVEERKRAIQDAEKDRREYILRKNQERDSRIETKRRSERSSIAFAFGSSTPRLLDPVDVGTMSNSSLWAHRRSTSISNVAYSAAPLSRRSSERELSDGTKKRATSAGGLDRNDGQRQMSTSMYEVFNWGPLNDARPKRYSLAIAGSQIDIGDGPQSAGDAAAASGTAGAGGRSGHHHQQQQHHHQQQQHQHNSSSQNRTDDVDLSYRSVCRRKTDLMPTIPSPRDGFGSRSSLYCHTPRTPVRAVSMTRLDQLAQPTRRNGEHIRAVIERQRQHHPNSDSMNSSICSSSFLSSSHHSHNTSTTTTTTTSYHNGKAANTTTNTPNTTNSVKRSRSMSRSLTHLAHSNSLHHHNSNGNNSPHQHHQRPTAAANRLPVGVATPRRHVAGLTPRPLAKTGAASKSMSTLLSRPAGRAASGPAPPDALSTSSGQLARAYANVKSKMRAAVSASTAHLAVVEDALAAPADESLGSGSRSGDVTPGTSRPGSALSTSTSVSGVLYRRSNGSTSATPRKPRPASIAGTDEANKLRSKEKPPLPRVSSAMRKSMTSSTNGLNSSTTTTPLSAPATPKETPKRTPTTERRVSSAVRKTSRPLSAHIPATTAPSSPATATAAVTAPPKSAIKKPTAVAEPIAAEQPAEAIETSNSEIPAEVSSKTEIELAASSAVDEIVETAANVATIKKSNSVEVDDIDEPFAAVAAEVASHPAAEAAATTTTAALNGTRAAETTPRSEPAAPVVPVHHTPAASAAAAAIAPHVLELPGGGGDDPMTASMIKRISTAEEAKAALAERRRLAREEAERQAELERQRQEEAERAEEQRLAEEEERQRCFEVETLRLVEDQRRAEELRLTQAIEEAAQREAAERQRLEDEERQREEREREEQRAREEAERQKIEVAERLKKEEKEREERRKRVEAIMSRTRAKGGSAAATPNATPSKADTDKASDSSNNSTTSSSSSNSISTSEPPSVQHIDDQQTVVVAPPAPIVDVVQPPPVVQATHTIADYEQSVTDKENSLINSFSNLIISNGQTGQQQQQTVVAQQLLLAADEPHLNGGSNLAKQPNGKQTALNFDLLNEADDVILRTNGNNGHSNHHQQHSLDNTIDSVVDNKETIVSNVADQLIDFSLESTTTTANNGTDGLLPPTQVNFNNNLLGGGSDSLNLVNSSGDSHEQHKELSLL